MTSATEPIVSPTSLPAALAAQTATPVPTAAEPTPTAAAETAVQPAETAEPRSPGALIQISMDSRVGVLLDEIPEEQREQVVADLMQQPEEYWQALAHRQVQLTKNRLNYRQFKYPGKWQLPLPPAELWSISIDPAGAQRKTIQGHDLLLVDYAFSSTLLSDQESPGQAEPALAAVGGVWQEPFVFPADPNLLLQRTSNACVNEGGYPPNSFDSENVGVFYDYSCQADSGGAAGCHRTRLPRLSCREALAARVGEIETNMRFERIAWDGDLADAVRVGPITNQDAPDLMVAGEDLDTNYISYRYIEPDNCGLEEGSLGGGGWRRLLHFGATVHNVGGQPLVIGPVVAEDTVNHVFEYSPCHDHFHYSHYGDFALGDVNQSQSSKQAFCVQSTSRYSNNEDSPLTHAYSCADQGIQTGWVDEYVAGLDSQWIDITELELPADGLSVALAFISNDDQFLCEGQPVLNDAGEKVWEPTGFTTEDGSSINRPQCNFMADWDVNNRAAREVFIPQKGSFVTQPCLNHELGPLRNCGFEELPDDELVCEPGETVQRTFSLQETAALQVVRVCEISAALGSGLACTFEQALANTIISQEPTTVSFLCPQIRDEAETAGGYALYTAPIWPADAAQAVVAVQN